MKDVKVPLRLLLAMLLLIGVLVLLVGWYLGRAGWNVSELVAGPVKLVPPTVATPNAEANNAAPVIQTVVVEPTRQSESQQPPSEKFVTVVVVVTATPQPAPTAQPLPTSMPTTPLALASPTAVPPPQPKPGTPKAPPTAAATRPDTAMRFPDLRVSSNASNGVQFTAPMDGNYEFTVKEGVYCTAPNLCRSVIRGYLGRDVVWKDWYGMPHPMEEDYELGCWENDTTSNPDCAIGLSVIVPMSASQYIRWIVMEDKSSFADNTGATVLTVRRLP